MASKERIGASSRGNLTGIEHINELIEKLEKGNTCIPYDGGHFSDLDQDGYRQTQNELLKAIAARGFEEALEMAPNLKIRGPKELYELCRDASKIGNEVAKNLPQTESGQALRHASTLLEPLSPSGHGKPQRLAEQQRRGVGSQLGQDAEGGDGTVRKHGESGNSSRGRNPSLSTIIKLFLFGLTR